MMENEHFQNITIKAHLISDMDFTSLEEQSTLFVSVPSYRDNETPKTLQHLFKKARFPERITVLVNEQNQRSIAGMTVSDSCDVSAINFPGSGKYKENIRLLQIPSFEARGPVIARAKIEQELYEPGEADYWLQIDAHMAFIKDWDCQLIRQHNMLPDPDSGILTTFPADFNPVNRAVPSLGLPNYIGFHDFNKNRSLPTQQRYQYRSFPDEPRKSLFFAAGFSFGPAEIMEKVPYDPYLDYIFLGEEISMAARLFTNGYDLYNPVTMPIYHLSNRTYRPNFWEQFHRKNAKAAPHIREERKKMENVAMDRIKEMIFHGNNPKENNGIYGLGTERSLEEFQQHIGIDLKNQIATPRARLGITENASEEEWKEKHAVSKEHWNVALRNLTPQTAPRVMALK